MEGTIGEIRMFAGTFNPRFWAFCNGQLISIASNTALFSILGTTYGGNGQTTFALPDLQGRIARGAGTGPGLPNVQLGERSGFPTVTLTQANMPAHTHPVTGTVTPQAASDGALSTDPTNRYLGPGAFYSSGASPVNMAAGTSSLTIGPNGGNQPFSIMPPTTGMNYIVCMFGIFPSRN